MFMYLCAVQIHEYIATPDVDGGGHGGEDAGRGAEQERNGGSCHGTDPTTGARGGTVPWDC